MHPVHAGRFRVVMLNALPNVTEWKLNDATATDPLASGMRSSYFMSFWR